MWFSIYLIKWKIWKKSQRTSEITNPVAICCLIFATVFYFFNTILNFVCIDFLFDIWFAVFSGLYFKEDYFWRVISAYGTSELVLIWYNTQCCTIHKSVNYSIHLFAAIWDCIKSNRRFCPSETVDSSFSGILSQMKRL